MSDHSTHEVTYSKELLLKDRKGQTDKYIEQDICFYGNLLWKESLSLFFMWNFEVFSLFLG